MKMLDPLKIPAWIKAQQKYNHYNHILAGVDDDDCAVLKFGKNFLVVTTDYVNASPIAIELGIGNYENIGALVVATNVGDLLSSGGRPIGFLLSAMLDRTSSQEDIKSLIDGVERQLKKYNIPLIGGDTKLGASTAICGTAVGICKSKRRLSLKAYAQVNDVIWISGNIGSVSAAVLGLKQPSLFSEKWNNWAKKVILEPTLPYEKLYSLTEKKFRKAGTDISDGLGYDLNEICVKSNVGAVIDIDKLPTHPNVRRLSNVLKIPVWKLQFSIGGDFQVIYTTSVRNRAVMNKLGFTEIGRVTEEKTLKLAFKENNYYEMPLHGHKDGRSGSFYEEVTELIEQITYDR